MRATDIDAEAQRVGELKRLELEQQFLKLQLQRCRKGMPTNHNWERHWRHHISKSVTAAIVQYLSSARRPPQTQYKRSRAPAYQVPQPQNNRPVAPVPQQPATQVAQFQNPAVQPYNRVAQQAPQTVQNRAVSKPAPGV